jgi:uracil-DNA glycosylase family 4
VDNDTQLSLFAGPSQIDKDSDLSGASSKDREMVQLIAEITACMACKLHSTRINTVPGEGNLDAEVMFIGEGPGADEDVKGRPFVGAAGRLLDAIINAMNFRREDVYIANIVKCRPPSNRIPEADEVDSCIGYLYRQIAIINPKMIILLGSTAYKAIIKDSKEGITKVRGRVLEQDGYIFMPTFHPAALLRDPSRKIDVWTDMKKVLSIIRKDS